MTYNSEQEIRDFEEAESQKSENQDAGMQKNPIKLEVESQEAGSNPKERLSIDEENSLDPDLTTPPTEEEQQSTYHPGTCYYCKETSDKTVSRIMLNETLEKRSACLNCQKRLHRDWKKEAKLIYGNMPNNINNGIMGG